MSNNDLEYFTISTFEVAMRNYSRFGNWLLLFLYDFPQHKLFASEPESIKHREKELKKMYIGFSFHPDDKDV